MQDMVFSFLLFFGKQLKNPNKSSFLPSVVMLQTAFDRLTNHFSHRKHVRYSLCLYNIFKRSFLFVKNLFKILERNTQNFFTYFDGK